MNSWPRSLVTLAGVTLALSACSTVRYSADYDPQTAFGDYRTYDWMVLEEAERAAFDRINPFLERRLQRAVGRELADRGFIRSVGDEQPDFLVSVFPILLRRDEDVRRRPNRGSRVNLFFGFTVGRGYPYRLPYSYPYFGYRYPYRGYYPYWFGFGHPYFAFSYPYFGYPSYYYRQPRNRLGPGTLAVDVIDGPSGQLAWRGWAEGALLDTPRAEELSAYADEVIGKILKRFPPAPEKR